MSNAAVKVVEKVNGTLTKEETEKLLVPLLDFQKVCGTKLSLRFNKDNTVEIKAINDAKSVIVFINYLAAGLPNLKIAEECRGHIYELDEFVSMAKIFNNGFSFVYNDSDRCIDLSSGSDDNNQSFRFYLSDETVIPKCPESLNFAKIQWFASFTWDSKKYNNFVKGMSTIRHPYVIFEGKKGESSVTISVTENKMKTTTLKTVIKLAKENAENYRVVLDKANFLNPVTSSIGTFEVDLSQKITRLTGASESHKVVYCVTSVVETND